MQVGEEEEESVLPPTLAADKKVYVCMGKKWRV